jgi:hypothetical protein
MARKNHHKIERKKKQCNEKGKFKTLRQNLNLHPLLFNSFATSYTGFRKYVSPATCASISSLYGPFSFVEVGTFVLAKSFSSKVVSFGSYIL